MVGQRQRQHNGAHYQSAISATYPHTFAAAPLNRLDSSRETPPRAETARLVDDRFRHPTHRPRADCNGDVSIFSGSPDSAGEG